MSNTTKEIERIRKAAKRAAKRAAKEANDFRAVQRLKMLNVIIHKIVLEVSNTHSVSVFIDNKGHVDFIKTQISASKPDVLDSLFFAISNDVCNGEIKNFAIMMEKVGGDLVLDLNDGEMKFTFRAMRNFGGPIEMSVPIGAKVIYDLCRK